MAAAARTDVLTKRDIFLVDGIGAVVTAAGVGIVLPLFGPAVGVPLWALVTLAAVGVGLAVYSFVNRALPERGMGVRLGVLIGGNLAYCVVTAGIVVGFWAGMHGLAVAYFLVEIAVVVPLVGVEAAVAWAAWKAEG